MKLCHTRADRPAVQKSYEITVGVSESDPAEISISYRLRNLTRKSCSLTHDWLVRPRSRDLRFRYCPRIPIRDRQQP